MLLDLVKGAEGKTSFFVKTLMPNHLFGGPIAWMIEVY